MDAAGADRATGPGLLIGIALGVVMLGAVQALAAAWTTKPYIGEFLYNSYFLALIQGELTVPAQIAGLEGFYDSEGRAFLYHGLGPLVTRLLAWPFVDLTATDLRGPTIWLFASLGATGLYAATTGFLARALPGERPAGLAALVWVLIWVLSPAFLLASNGSFYHEPVGFAFAMLGLGLFCLWRLVDSEFTRWPWLLGLAVAAGLAVHARPHVALGLYAATGIGALMLLWRVRGQAVLPAGAALAILLLAGLAYLQMNALRFGAATEISGTVSETGGRPVYGFKYWGWEPPDHPRFRSQETHGDFMAGRILPNLFLYAVSMGGETSEALYRRMTADMGFIRIEPPVLGFVMVWMPWCLLAVIGLVKRRGARAFFWLGLAATVPAALVMLSYTTVTFRYRTEIWPVLYVLGLFGLAGLLSGRAEEPESLGRLVRSLWIAALAAVGVTVFASYIYLDILNWEWGTAMRSYADCARMVAEHPGLGAGKVAEICVLDVPEG